MQSSESSRQATILLYVAATCLFHILRFFSNKSMSDKAGGTGGEKKGGCLVGYKVGCNKSGKWSRVCINPHGLSDPNMLSDCFIIPGTPLHGAIGLSKLS